MSNSSMYLKALPSWFVQPAAKWSWISLSAFVTLQGHFNRTIFDAPWAGQVSDSSLAQTLQNINTTDFVVYDSKFFSIIGAEATIEHVQKLAYQSHEAPCYIQNTRQLFFVEWGPPGGVDGIHKWQYLLDVDTNSLKRIVTDPPTFNAHGCVSYQDHLYVATDGAGSSESGSLPFAGFNDLEMDREGNFYLTDSKSGWGREIVNFAPPTSPSIYFVNSTTMQSKVIWTTDGNANGVAISPDGKTLYIPDTGVSNFRPSNKNPYGKRMLWAFDISGSGAVLANKRMLGNPLSYFYDGIRASREGWLFAGSGDGVDVIDPETGFVLGSIRVGGGSNVAVSLAFGEHEMWIVGKGGVWHVKNIKAQLMRDW
ncbi:hypothetical protein N7467_003107 [Penicillium canescens]|nr:hypothetical protein N7467_003107 [Penicillium canescens]